MPMRSVLLTSALLGAAFVHTPSTDSTTTPAQPAARAIGPQAATGTFAFVDVNVLPMDRNRVLTGQTVIVRDGRITAVGPTASVRVPSKAQRELLERLKKAFDPDNRLAPLPWQAHSIQ